MFQLSYSIENPEVDIEIQEIFTSTQLTKRLLCYKLNEKLYKVLLVHNPEKVKLTSTVNFNTSEHGRSSCVASCNKKVCIFVDNKAPRALIKHISSFHNLSWWDRCWNLSVCNGSKLRAQITEKKRFSTSYTIRTYTLCSWYEAMMNAKP